MDVAERLRAIRERRQGVSYITDPCEVRRSPTYGYAIKHPTGLFYVEVGQAPKLAEFWAYAAADTDFLLRHIDELTERTAVLEGLLREARQHFPDGRGHLAAEGRCQRCGGSTPRLAVQYCRVCMGKRIDATLSIHDKAKGGTQA